MINVVCTRVRYRCPAKRSLAAPFELAVSIGGRPAAEDREPERRHGPRLQNGQIGCESTAFRRPKQEI